MTIFISFQKINEKKKLTKEIGKKIGRIRVQDWLLTCNEHDNICTYSLFLNVFHIFFTEYIGDMFTGLLGNVRFKSYGTWDTTRNSRLTTSRTVCKRKKRPQNIFWCKCLIIFLNFTSELCWPQWNSVDYLWTISQSRMLREFLIRIHVEFRPNKHGFGILT